MYVTLYTIELCIFSTNVQKDSTVHEYVQSFLWARAHGSFLMSLNATLTSFPVCRFKLWSCLMSCPGDRNVCREMLVKLWFGFCFVHRTTEEHFIQHAICFILNRYVVNVGWLATLILVNSDVFPYVLLSKLWNEFESFSALQIVPSRWTMFSRFILLVKEEKDPIRLTVFTKVACSKGKRAYLWPARMWSSFLKDLWVPPPANICHLKLAVKVASQSFC